MLIITNMSFKVKVTFHLSELTLTYPEVKGSEQLPLAIFSDGVDSMTILFVDHDEKTRWAREVLTAQQELKSQIRQTVTAAVQ